MKEHKTAEEILHEHHKGINEWKSWSIIDAMEEYASQYKSALEEREREIEKLKCAVTDEDINFWIKKCGEYAAELSTLRAENEELKVFKKQVSIHLDVPVNNGWAHHVNAIMKLKSQPIDVEGLREKFNKQLPITQTMECWNPTNTEIFEWFLPYLSKGTKQE